ncbi:glutathione S-transferase 3-like [Pecten maximus]|uniref:glutathione S-transferase 3-like n=1 Tax=Pecten maximus TaxID=6579 RepID=UPI001458CAAC|nr:glutathione S-transferase 3-like [Pecten maximus]
MGKIDLHSIAGPGVLIAVVCLWCYYRKTESHRRKESRHRITLYTYPNYRSMRCIWLATELGIDNNIKMIEMDPHDKRKCESYKTAVHPHCTIPALVLEDGNTIIESGAICLYMADFHKSLVPETQWIADYYNWIVYACSTLDDMMETIYLQWYLTDSEDQNEQLVKRMTDKFQVFADYFNNYLKGKSFICGDKFTAADCIMGYNIWWASGMREGCLIDQYPEIISYLSRLQSRYAFQNTFPS